MVRGPRPLRERKAQPCSARMIATGNAAAREWAWKSLQPNTTARPDVADLGEMEPSVPDQG